MTADPRWCASLARRTIFFIGTAWLIAIVAKPLIGADEVVDAVSVARTRIGKAYATNGKGPEEFDCSGLTQYSYAQVGIAIDKGTASQQSNGTAVSGDIQRGDLLFFDTNDKKRPTPTTINHVAIYTGENSIVTAPDVGRFVEEVTYSSWWRSRLLKARRIVMPTPTPTPVPAPPPGSGVTTDLTRTGNYSGRFTTQFPVRLEGNGDSCESVETRGGELLLVILVKSDDSVPEAKLFVTYSNLSWSTITCQSRAIYPPGVWFWLPNFGGLLQRFTGPAGAFETRGQLLNTGVVQDILFTGGLRFPQAGGSAFVAGRFSETLHATFGPQGGSSFTVDVTLTRDPTQ